MTGALEMELSSLKRGQTSLLIGPNYINYYIKKGSKRLGLISGCGWCVNSDIHFELNPISAPVRNSTGFGVTIWSDHEWLVLIIQNYEWGWEWPRQNKQRLHKIERKLVSILFCLTITIFFIAGWYCFICCTTEFYYSIVYTVQFSELY